MYDVICHYFRKYKVLTDGLILFIIILKLPNTLPVCEMLVLEPDGVSGFPDPDRLEHSGVSELLEDDGHVELHRALVAVRLHATDEPRVAIAHRSQKLK